MGKRRRGKGEWRRGPFTYADMERGIKLDGWVPTRPGDHRNFKHPMRSGKIQLDEKWSGVKPSHSTFKGVCSQGGYSKDELLSLLNGVPLDD